MAEEYNMVVIGAGAAGLTAAAFVGELGGKVALIEKRQVLGGDCTWVGCVPSKALLKVSKIAHAVRTAHKYGITTSEPTIDMSTVRDFVQRAIHDVYQFETPERVAERGVEVIIGEAKFVDAHTVEVNSRQLRAKNIVIATGSRAMKPPIEGIDDVPYVTNETIFDNDRLPEHLLIIGGGPIGIEMGQAHVRLGARVTIMDKGIFRKDEPEVAEVMQPILEEEGIVFKFGMVERVSRDGDAIICHMDGEEVRGDMLLVAAGRKPTVETLGLEAAGVKYSEKGIPVNEHLQTNVEHIYAVGDCTTGPKFTHYAGFQGSVAARNAVLPVVNTTGIAEDKLPWVTFTEPEVAHTGLTEAQARERYGDAVKVLHFDNEEGDRTQAEGDTRGFIKIVYKGSGDILGATIIANRAGDMIIEYSLAMQKGISIRDITGTMHAYPSYSDVARKAMSQLMIKELMAGTSGRVLKLASRAIF